MFAAFAIGAATLTDTEQAAAELAIETITAELGVARESIEISAVRAVDWRDSSFGCPKPGKAYLDVITKGYEVRLRAEGQDHVMHVAGNRAFECRPDKRLRGLKPADASQKRGR